MFFLSLFISCAFVSDKDLDDRSDEIDQPSTDSAEPSDDTGEPSDDTSEPSDDTGDALDDLDGDGFDTSEDCDDTDSNINPGQEEIPVDGIDQNCDGMELCYEDLDGDGFGSENKIESDDLECSTSGLTSLTGDCLDDNNSVYPGAAIEEDETACTLDADGDGFGDKNPPTGVDAGTDCDDTTTEVHPNADDIIDDGIDNNCDGLEVCYVDEDDDGYRSSDSSLTTSSSDLDCEDNGEGASSEPDTDCNDLDSTINPGASDSLFSDLDCVTGLSDTSLANSSYIISGEDAGDRVGDFVRAAGDVDGDGLDDLFIGAMGRGENGPFSGKAYIVLGSSLLASSSIDLANADYTFVGNSSFESVGQFVTSAGDVDGDGKDDILLSSTGNSDHESNGGKIYLFLSSSLGSNSSIGLADADYTFYGENPFDFVGRVDSAGDVDGDGLDDIIIGTGYNDEIAPSAGKSYLILGANLGNLGTTISLADADYSFLGVEEDGFAGAAVSSAGDVDGDGKDDILIGAPGSANFQGKVYLILGSTIINNPNANDPSILFLSEADYTFIGENGGDRLGAAISPAGDINGDGLADILLSAPDRNNSTGSTYLILGSGLSTNSTFDVINADYIFEGEGSLYNTGTFMSPGGDVDGDGLDDIILGATGANEVGVDAGKVYLTLASSLGSQSLINLSSADYSFLGEQEGDFAGAASISGDVNGDGKNDVVVGAFGANNGDFTGKIYVILSEL